MEEFLEENQNFITVHMAEKGLSVTVPCDILFSIIDWWPSGQFVCAYLS